MEREPVWYGDLDLTPPTPEQYHENLLLQVEYYDTIDPDTLTSVLESMIDTRNSIPVVTDEYKLAFCRVTHSLPELCQSHIWSVLMILDSNIEPPPTPKKTYRMSDRMRSHMDRWASRKLVF